MTEWFEHSNGYVNIDAANIYFTNSGNWSETSALQEKGIQKSNWLRKLRISLVILLVALLFGLLFFMNLLKENKSLFLIIGLPLCFFYFYNYLKRETGSRYQLPISKIVSIEISDKTAIINFKDYNNKEEEEVLYALPEKGLIILKQLQKKFATKAI